MATEAVDVPLAVVTDLLGSVDAGAVTGSKNDAFETLLTNSFAITSRFSIAGITDHNGTLRTHELCSAENCFIDEGALTTLAPDS